MWPETDVFKRDKLHRRPVLQKVKHKSEETVHLQKTASNADDPFASLKSLPQLGLQHPDVTAVPDAFSHHLQSAGMCEECILSFFSLVSLLMSFSCVFTHFILRTGVVLTC